MSFWAFLAVSSQLFMLAYFVTLNLVQALFSYLGLRESVIVHAREFSQVALKDLLERDVHKPVSVIVPAYNERECIVGSLRSFLSLRFPQFEVIVASDGSTDDTLGLLIESFALVEQSWTYRDDLASRPVRRIFRSQTHPNLLVLDKENGGRADAMNAALNLARYPLVCAVDADSMLDGEALLMATRQFVEDDTLIAVGGTVRPINGATIQDGHVTGLRMPRRWIERFQILEYARAFFTGRAGWSFFDSLLIISGAFGLFRRDAVLEAGGYSTKTVCEDMELVVRLHRLFKGSRRPYRISFTPDPICWTEVPSDIRTLRRQRNRWQRGLWETLWLHRSMFGNPRYGRLGVVAMPYFLLFEALGPIVEAIGYVLLPVLFLFGLLSTQFALLFLILAIAYGMLLSQLAAGIEIFLLARYPGTRDRFTLFTASFLEFFGYRQLLAMERLIASFQVLKKRGQWGEMTRMGLLGPKPDARAEVLAPDGTYSLPEAPVPGTPRAGHESSATVDESSVALVERGISS